MGETGCQLAHCGDHSRKRAYLGLCPERSDPAAVPKRLFPGSPCFSFLGRGVRSYSPPLTIHIQNPRPTSQKLPTKKIEGPKSAKVAP